MTMERVKRLEPAKRPQKALLFGAPTSAFMCLRRCGGGRGKTPEELKFVFENDNGAGDEARTRYLHLGKVALYQMSYTRIRGIL